MQTIYNGETVSAWAPWNAHLLARQDDRITDNRPWGQQPNPLLLSFSIRHEQRSWKSCIEWQVSNAWLRHTKNHKTPWQRTRHLLQYLKNAMQTKAAIIPSFCPTQKPSPTAKPTLVYFPCDLFWSTQKVTKFQSNLLSLWLPRKTTLLLE